MGQRDGNFETKNEIICMESKSVVNPTPSQSNKANDNCCGVKWVWTGNENNPGSNCLNCNDCRLCCQECARYMPPFSWHCCLYNFASILCYITIIALSIYWIAVTEPRLDDCRAFTAFERHDCLNDMNGALVGFCFSICAMIFSFFRIIWCFVWLCDEQFRRPHATYECTDCRPNRPLGFRLARIIGCTLFLSGIFLLMYCVQFIEWCRDGDDVCKSYKSDTSGGNTTGFIFAILFLNCGLATLLGSSKQ